MVNEIETPPFENFGVLVGKVDLIPSLDEVDEQTWDGLIGQKMSWSMTMDFEIPDPWAKSELMRLLRPRVNRRVTTTVINPNPQHSSIMAFAEFYQDGWLAGGLVRKLPSGNIEVVWTTAWANMREN